MQSHSSLTGLGLKSQGGDGAQSNKEVYMDDLALCEPIKLQERASLRSH